MLVGKIHKNCVISRKPFMIGTFLFFYSSVLWALYRPDLKAIWRIYSTDESSNSLRPYHTLPDSTNGRETDSKILSPFVPVRMRFLSIPHAVNASRVR